MFNRVEDITTHPKRTQAENVINAGRSFEQSIHSNSGIPEPVEVPVSYTLESVIEFYNTHQSGPLAKLYEYTAFVLDKYRQFLMQTIRQQESHPYEESVEESYEEPETDDSEE